MAAREGKDAAAAQTSRGSRALFDAPAFSATPPRRVRRRASDTRRMRRRWLSLTARTPDVKVRVVRVQGDELVADDARRVVHEVFRASARGPRGRLVVDADISAIQLK